MRSMNHPVRTLLLAGTLVASTFLGPGSQIVPLSHATAAAAPNEQVTAAALARFNAKLAALTKAHTFSGTVLVAQGDTVLLRKGYGMADQDKKIPNTVATEFINHILLNEFSAVAILQLEDAGKLRDQDHLCTYIPHCPATWATITIRELLNGTSGIHDIVNKPTLGESISQSYTLAQLADLTMQEPLEHKPGSSVDSNITCTQVIREYLVERISGASFGTYIEDHFLRPLGLRHTGYFLHTPKHVQLAAGYQSWQVPAAYYPDQYDMSLFGGSVYSTVDDSLRWEQALDSGKILSPASTARLLAPSYLLCRTLASCGSGYTSAGTTEGRWIVAWDSHPITYLNGVLPDIGFEAMTEYYTDAKVTLLFLANQGGSLQNSAEVDRLLFS